MLQKFWYVFFLSFLSVFVLQAQNDSLIGLLETRYQKPSKIRVNILNNLAKSYRIKTPQQARIYTQKASETAIKINYSEGLALAYNHEGVSYYIQGNFEQAEVFFEKSLKIRELIGDQKGIASSLNNLGNIAKNQGNYGKALTRFEKCLGIRRQTKNLKGEYAALNNIGNVYFYQADYQNAVKYYFDALKIAEKMNYSYGMGSTYSNIGVIYEKLEDHDKALDYHLKSLEIKEKIDDIRGLGISYNNLGINYAHIKNFDKAVEYYQKSIKIEEEIGDKRGIGHTKNYLGEALIGKQMFEEALKNFREAQEMFREMKDINSEIYSMNLIGKVYTKEKKFEQAEKVLEKALKMAKEHQIKEQELATYLGLSEFYDAAQKYDKAFRNYQNYTKLRDEIFNKEKSEQIAKLQTIYETDKKEQALALKEKEILVLNQENEIQELELNRQKTLNGKKQAELALLSKAKEVEKLEFMRRETKRKNQIELLEKEKELAKEREKLLKEREKISQERAKRQNEELARRRNIIIAFIVGFAVLILLTVFLIRSNRLRKIANQTLVIKNEEINQQHEEISTIAENLKTANEEISTKSEALQGALDKVEQKNKDITASISYALRIQQALLPPIGQIQSLLPESFIFYQPRDIVSGDFYWFGESQDKIIITAVDCTGHGVPGAFMSMLGSSALNNIVLQQNIIEADKILQELNQEIQVILRQNQTSVKDGMDIALCVIDKRKKTLEFSGAHNPLFYVQGQDLLVLKGVRTSIGGYEDSIQFEKYEINIQEKTQFYIFSDGYQDQFGGKRGRKFMTSNFRELCKTNAFLPAKEQEKNFETTLLNWKEDRRQVDDILVIGFCV